MKRILILFSALFCTCVNLLFAQTTQESNCWGAKKTPSDFHIGVDLQTKYVWRGMEMITSDASPVVFPQINYQNKGWYAYAMGGYALNGKYAEVDLGVCYTWRWLTIGLNDYYYPTIMDQFDQYFNLKKNDTGHWMEGTITIAPEAIPVYLVVSNFFYGADKRPDGKQAYSTYAELGTYYDFLEDNRISLAIGAALNKSCYNGYEKNFSICNIEGKYTYNLGFKNDWNLPLSVAYIYNPVYDKAFVNFTANIAF